MNPIERLIAAGHTEILHESGWAFDETRSEWYCYILGPGKFAENASEALSIHIQLAGMAALEWLSSRGPWKSGQKAKYRYCISTEAGDFEAPTLDEAAIDAAIAVWEASRG